MRAKLMWERWGLWREFSSLPRWGASGMKTKNRA
jgi:hypothetical protein